MLNRVLAGALAMLAVVMFLGTTGMADEKSGSHDGIVVKAGDAKLVMTDKAGKNEHTMTVSKTAKITCDGKNCQLEDLRKGFTIRVETDAVNKTVATRIDAKKSGSQ
jgi:hypothetical protein